MGRDDAALNGRDDSHMIKKQLQPGLKIKEDIFIVQKAVYNPFSDLCRVFQGFLMLAFRPVRFSGIPGGREESAAAVKTMIRKDPETIHEVKIRAERRKGIRGTANESGKDAVTGESFYPVREGRRCQPHGKQEKEKDEGTQYLGLVLGGPASSGIKREKKGHGSVRIKKPEFLPRGPKIRMEPCPFGRRERSFRVGEKGLVVMHGLPVLDHSAVPPCK